ncbi:MAG TPA: alkaline phosphatase [Rhodospirillales bacterium]|nr:alkaline phosphatase [Rhodospirillales bacterium]
MLLASFAGSVLIVAGPALATPPGKNEADLRPLAERLAEANAREDAHDAAALRPAATLPTGNVIFLHPDGTGPSWWQAGRTYWAGPDGSLSWDRLPYMAAYRGHSNDINIPAVDRGLVSSSNSGATIHAFGFKVQVADSFGQDSARPIRALSGFRGSIMRQAANNGHPVGVVNDGDLAEPGSGVFLAEVGSRGEGGEILAQMIFGRPGLTDRSPVVLLGGGEGFALPSTAPQCAAGTIADDCYLHVDPVTGRGPERTDGRNLIAEAKAAGWVVIRTRGEYDALLTRLKTQPRYNPRVLGLFARDDIFNDTQEEVLIAAGLVNAGVPASDKRGRIILYGGRPGTPSFNPPTAAEMTEMATIILERRAAARGKPFMLVAEVEGTDNFGNTNNAIGGLVALKNADDMIAVSRMFQERVPNTLILTAADGDAGQMTVLSFGPSAGPQFRTFDSNGIVLPVNSYNPNGTSSLNVLPPPDGFEGRLTRTFEASPDDFGTVYQFGIGWIGTPDNYGSVISRAQGLNAELLQTEFSQRFDNTDVYRLMYATLFGTMLPPAYGRTAPDR